MSYSDATAKAAAERRGRTRVATAAGVLVMLLSACLSAAVLGSEPLLDWADDVSDRTGTSSLHDAAEAWRDALRKLGLTKPYTSVREQARAVEQSGFAPPPHD